MYHLHTDVIEVPIKQIKQCSWQQEATLEPQLCVCLLTEFICVCVQYMPACWQWLHVCVCSCMLYMNIPLWLSKARRALDRPQLRAPKIEPWSHPFHRSGPPSSSTPTPHTVSITWTQRITLWHKTRVCPLYDWVCSSIRCSAWKHGDLGGSEMSLWQELSLGSKSEGWSLFLDILKVFEMNELY